ncbi:Protein-L-isoaspartate O-methyltransferase [subsurface metagenome]
MVGDGSKGWKEYAPYDRILVTAAASSVPRPLKEQLADNGILVIPIGESHSYQNIIIIQRLGNRFESWESIGCRFVPLVCDDEID